MRLSSPRSRGPVLGKRLGELIRRPLVQAGPSRRGCPPGSRAAALGAEQTVVCISMHFHPNAQSLWKASRNLCAVPRSRHRIRIALPHARFLCDATTLSVHPTLYFSCSTPRHTRHHHHRPRKSRSCTLASSHTSLPRTSPTSRGKTIARGLLLPASLEWAGGWCSHGGRWDVTPLDHGWFELSCSCPETRAQPLWAPRGPASQLVPSPSTRQKT